MVIGLALFGLSAGAQVPDCDAALEQARQDDRARDWAALADSATRAARCAPDELVALALVAKAAEASGDWKAQREAARRGEGAATTPAIAKRFALSRRRAEVLLALDAGERDAARRQLRAIDTAGDDPALDAWVRDRLLELESVDEVSATDTCATTFAPPADPKTALARGVRDRNSALEAWCSATQAVAERNAGALVSVLAAAREAPVPHVGDVLPGQLSVLEALQTGDAARVRAGLNALAAFPAYPGIERFVDEVEVPGRRRQTGAALGVLGGGLAIGGGALVLVGRSGVQDVIDEGLCREVPGGYRCTGAGEEQVARGEAQQIAGIALVGVGAALAASGVAIELTRSVHLEGAPRGVALKIRW